jgi:hypothetical protein
MKAGWESKILPSSSPRLKLWMLGWQLYCHPGATVQLSPQLIHKISRGELLAQAFTPGDGICRLKFSNINPVYGVPLLQDETPKGAN